MTRFDRSSSAVGVAVPVEGCWSGVLTVDGVSVGFDWMTGACFVVDGGVTVGWTVVGFVTVAAGGVPD